MIGNVFIVFLAFCVWKALARVPQEEDSLALAQLSRTRLGASSQDGTVRLSRVDKPEDLTVEAPPSSHSQGGLGEADADILRSLTLSDTVLLASIDGRFHAVNRTTGRTIWSMEDDRDTSPSLHSLVRTDHNLSPSLPPDSDNQELYIIEPQSGDIFVLSSSPSEGMSSPLVAGHAQAVDRLTFTLDDSNSPEPLRRLPYSVPQLVEHSPFSFDDPNRVFVGKKETSIIEVDLDEGIVTSVMGGTNSWHNDSEEDEGSDDLPKSRNRRIVQVGRTDYTINVISHSCLLQTLSFSTYGPNNMHKPLQSVWKRTPDDIYLQPSWDYRTYAFETLGELPLWIKGFKQPVVAVFDVVLQNSGTSKPKPVVLLQPRPKLQELFPTKAAHLDGIRDKAAIIRIGDSLFAMGHLNYPLVNLVEPPAQIEPPPTEEGQGCVGIGCYTGFRYTEMEGAKSRISRLIEAGPGNNKSNVSPRAVAETNFENPLPTPSEIAAIPLPSRSSILGPDGNFIGLESQIDNTRPKPQMAPTWTFILPFVGGFMAIWLLLRKLLKTASTRRDRLIQPLQNSNSPTDATALLVTPSGAHSRHPSAPGIVYPAFTGATTYTAADSGSPRVAPTSQRPDSSEFNEKRGLSSERDDEEANLSLALEDARVGSGLGLSVEIRDAEESDGDEGDGQDNKKRTRRGKRGRNKHKKPKLPTTSSQGGADAPGPSGQASGQDSGSASADYVMVEQPHADKAPIKMELPLPVTTSSSSLVVTSKVLGYGSHGTIVFEGALQGRAVAVKRLLHDFVTLASHEVSLLLQADDHPNVIRYFFSMTRDSFLYIALELCPCSLADLIESPNKHPAITGSFEPKRALQQITQGLRHLHNLKIVHRDIKPQNILVSRPNRDGMHRMLISDFGLCKKLEVDQTSFLPTAAGGQSLFAAGTPGWRAPEILRGDVSLDENAVANAGSSSGSDSAPGSSNSKSNSEGTRLTKSVDIFALGCLFYYTLVNGEHPFGERYIREVNILKGDMELKGLERFGEEGVEAGNLIEWMLEQDPKSRPDTEAILVHPYFWTPARRLAFLQDASDRFEIMEREPREAGLVALETGAFGIVGADWHKRLDKLFIENLGKYRKYQGASVQDLLRALRNKKHHYQDLPDNVKRHLGPLPDGFLSYFTRRFPDLFLHVHGVISNLPLRYEPMFKGYFELDP